jgi:glycosyltransferase involved in cell wall biosynthesis
MKTAIVHDHIQEFGGAERVLVSIKKAFPKADVFTAFYTPESLGNHAGIFKDWNITTSWADKIPFLKKLYSPFRFLLPWIWESFNFNSYDLVISSSGWFMCKGIITKPSTLHVSYIHHPPRSFYYYETAVEWQKYLPFKIYGTLINHGLRMWDYIGSQRPDYFIANSQETKKRVQKFYRRDADVIYPSVTVPKELPDSDGKQDYYLTVSRLARAKHIDVLIKAANEKKFKLKVVGTGRDEEHLKSLAGETVEFLGNITDEELAHVYADAKAFLFASVDEEFGIVVAEAMGRGVPVIAYASGGVPELVTDKNGFLFYELSPHSIIEQIQKLEKLAKIEYTQMRINAREQSLQFSEEKFIQKLKDYVAKVAKDRFEKKWEVDN